MIYIGIDPGLTGAVAVLYGEVREPVVYDLPVVAVSGGVVQNEVSGARLITLLRSIPAAAAGKVVVERTGPMPKQGVVSMFSMGCTRGTILTALAAVGVAPFEVWPQQWKWHFKLIGAGKDRSLELARELFPSLAAHLHLAKHHNRAEALLLAEYLRLGMPGATAPGSAPRKRRKRLKADDYVEIT